MIRKAISSRCCFRPSGATTTNLATSLYTTSVGILALTWSHTFLGSSVDIHLLPHHHLRRRITFFWNKTGSHQLILPSGGAATLIWDLTRAKFGPGSEPQSGFHISLVLNSQTLLHIGDIGPKPGPGSGSLVVRREHVHSAKRHVTKISFGGKTRSITIDCDGSDPDPRLVIRVEDKKVLQVKHLRWKFRGGERIEVDGHPILISWDVYNWLFDDYDNGEGFALFTLRFEVDADATGDCGGGERVLLSEELPAERGWRKKKGLLANTKTALSSVASLSSASSSACGSVLDWESVEETELKGPTGFSLLVYAWKT